MPRHASRRQMPRDIVAPAQSDQVRAVLGSDLLFDLSSVLHAQSSKGGFPDLMLFGVHACCGAFGSQEAVLKYLRSSGAWADVCRVYLDMLGTSFPLPTGAPDAHDMDRFLRKISNDDHVRVQILKAFTKSSIALATRLGNFTPMDVVDFTKPAPQNMVFGDGTFYQPFSDVKEIVDKVTGEIIPVGSRAKTKPRIQRVVTNAGRDGKGLRGINHVTISTWTKSGWVVLMMDQALRSETPVAVRMLTNLKSEIGAGLVWAVWDRAVRGKAWRRLKDKICLDVIGKEPARSKPPAGEFISHLTRQAAVERHAQGKPLPLGVSVYKTEKGHDVTNSKFIKLGDLSQGSCTHELYVDDAALFAVSFDSSSQAKLKVSRAKAKRETREPARETPEPTVENWTDDYTNHVEWDLPCPDHFGVVHKFSTVWRPFEQRFFAQDENGHYTGSGLKDLRPLSRSDQEIFLAIHGYRNIAEALHAWLKARLGTTKNRGRATRINQHQQLMHHVGLCFLANAITERSAEYGIEYPSLKAA
jgi:hypothetical protein